MPIGIPRAAHVVDFEAVARRDVASLELERVVNRAAVREEAFEFGVEVVWRARVVLRSNDVPFPRKGEKEFS